MEACIGDIRVKGGNWWALNDHLNNENPLDITYCEYCVKNKCVPVDNIYQVDLDQAKDYNINCDCPNKFDHRLNGKCIFPYRCAMHRTKENRGMLMTCDMRKCTNCNDYTASSAIKYCDSCSYNLQLCCYCGQ